MALVAMLFGFSKGGYVKKCRLVPRCMESNGDACPKISSTTEPGSNKIIFVFPLKVNNGYLGIFNNKIKTIFKIVYFFPKEKK
jgi:hypothetical protein